MIGHMKEKKKVITITITKEIRKLYGIISK
jgi:hypothetical protein